MSVISPQYVDGLEIYIEQLRSKNADLEQQLSALRAEREWVPVSEGLPESKGFDDGTIYVWVSDEDAHIGGICELTSWHEYWPVEQYMALPPLPTPPTTEEGQ